MTRSVWIQLGLVAATLVAYGQAAGFPFVLLDDPQYITDVPYVLDGLSVGGFVWALDSYATASNWHPLTWLSHMLDVELFGLDAGRHHVTSFVLHALNGVLLFRILRDTTGREGRSAVVAALFVLHPLHVESVAWISERKDVLSALFGLLAIQLYVAYARCGGAGRYAGVLVLFALSLAAKSMMVTLPCVLLLLDYWPLRRVRLPGLASAESKTTDPAAPAATPERSAGFLVAEKIPLLLLSLACGAITVLAQQDSGAVSVGSAIPLASRLANSAVSYVRYLGKTFWPTELVVLYPHPYLPGGEPWAAWQVAGALAVLAGVFTSAVLWRRQRWLAVGWLWFVGTLVPVIGWLQVGFQGMADRYTYFPSIGLFVAIVWSAGTLLERVPGPARRVKLLNAGTSAVVLAASLALTVRQTEVWADSIALYSHAIAHEPVSPVIFKYRADAWTLAGEPLRALADLEQAVERNPRLAPAYAAAGILHLDLGQDEKALDAFERAVALEPDSAVGHGNRAIAYGRLGRPDEALRDYETSLALAPDAPARWNERGVLEQLTGRSAAARASFEQAAARDPGYAVAHRNLGWLLATCPDAAVRDGEGAVRAATRACELASDLACIGTLAAAYAEAGRFAEAVSLVERTLPQAPPEARRRLQDMLERFRRQEPIRDSG